MKYLVHCPVCAEELVTKQVTKILRGGGNTASIRVHAGVCLSCGERLYSLETVHQFESIRAKLKRQETSQFKSTGRAFQVV